MERGSSHPTPPHGWCHGLSQTGLEVSLLPGNGMVLIDRQPCIEGDPARWLSLGIMGPAGTYATAVEEACPYALEGLRANERLLHTVHGGLDGGAAMVVDQYLLLQDDVPACLVRMVMPVNGRRSMDEAMHHDLLMRFLGRNTAQPANDAPL